MGVWATSSQCKEKGPKVHHNDPAPFIFPVPLTTRHIQGATTFSEWLEQKGKEMRFRDILREESMEGLITCIKELGLYPESSGEPLKDSKQIEFRMLLWQHYGG